MFKKRLKRPLFTRKNKAGKEAKTNHNVDSASDTSLIEDDREIEHNRSPRRRNRQRYNRDYSEHYRSPRPRNRQRYNREYSEQYRSPHPRNRQRYNREYSEIYRSPRRRNRERYNREYSDYEQHYDDRKFYYDYHDRKMYNSDDEMFEYTADVSQYYRSPVTSYSEESDLDCEICNNYRKNINRRTYDDSEYSYHKHRPKRRHEPKKNSRPADLSETERPYRKDYNVYNAHQPIKHHAFQNKQQHEEMRRASDTNVNTNETVEDDSELDIRTSGLEYEVYAAQTRQNQAGASRRQRRSISHEKLIGVTEFNRDVPIIGLKDKSTNNYLNRSKSDIIYLPVIVLNENISLPKTKVISYGTLANKAGENVDQLLEKNIHLFPASYIDHHDKFARVNNGAKERTLEPLLTHNINIYTADIQQTNPFKKSKSTTSISHNKSLLDETDLLESDHPTQRSYINDAPTKLGDKTNITGKVPNRPKRSKSNISNRSLIGSTRSSSPKGAGFFSKIHLQDLQARRERKRGIKPLDVSAVVPHFHPSNHMLENEIHQDEETINIPEHNIFVLDESGITDNKSELRTSQTNIAATTESQGLVEKSIAEESKAASIIDEKSHIETRESLSSELGKTVVGETEISPTEEQEPFLKKEIKVVENEHQNHTIKSMPSVPLEGGKFPKPSEKPLQINESVLMVPQKKPRTSRWFSKKKEPLMKSLKPKEYVRHLENVNTIDGTLESYNQDSLKKTTQSSPKTTVTQINDMMGKLQRQGSQKRNILSQSDVIDKKDIDRNTEPKEDHIDNIKKPDSDDYKLLTVMEYNLIPALINAFLLAQVFLGLSLHSTVLNIVRTLGDGQS